MTETTHHSETITTSTQPSPRAPRALLLTVQRQRQSDAQHAASCLELKRLAHTLGLDVVGVESQKRTEPSRRTYVGSGRLREVAALTGGRGVVLSFGEVPEPAPGEGAPPGTSSVDLVLVNDTLEPRLHRDLERALGVEVLDRTGVILEIFELRAQTREARLEVEIARLRYELPRLRDDTTQQGRRGGGGRGERGHTVVAMGKARVRARIAALEAELEATRVGERTRRRRRQAVFQVALVGYTNAGKSSLMRALTGSEVLVEDKLFASLGTTARQLSPPASPAVVVSDTVGFIQALPHELVASFRSTLEEARDAQLVWLVLDASDPSWPEHLEVTRETLASIKVDATKQRVLFNKVDRLDEEARAALRLAWPQACLTSAHDLEQVAELRATILGVQALGFLEETLWVPFEQGSLKAEIYAQAHVHGEVHDGRGTTMSVRAEEAWLNRWRARLPRR